MTSWSKKDRLSAVLAGKLPDRPPVSAWGHFVGREENAKDLAEATIEFQKDYDWDFVKINPRATIFGEAWGNVSDFDNYIGDVPAISEHVIHDVSDIEKIKEIDPTTGKFGEQLEVTKLVKEGVGNTPVLQTLFTPMSVLEYLCGHRTVASSRSAARDSSPLPKLIEEHPEAVHRALQNITQTLISYVEHSIKAGADGFFYAVLGLARDGLLTEEEFKEFGTQYDEMILEAAKDSFLLLHTCGPESNADRFKDYPIHAIHWADRMKENPTLLEATNWIGNKSVMGGVFEELFTETNIDKVESQAKETIEMLRNHPFILAPGCGLPPNTNPKAVRALRESVEK